MNSNFLGDYRRICGIDEAGRGPVIGPMVLASVVIDRQFLPTLLEMGIRDSKKLSPSARLKIYKTVGRLLASVNVLVIDPKTIDNAVKGLSFRNLNDLESYFTAFLIKKALPCKPELFIVDSPDINPLRYRERILFHLKRMGVKVPRDVILCENKADVKYLPVSAASIISKVRRDLLINKLKYIYGDIGSGYPTDPATIKFLEKSLSKGKVPPIVRFTWNTFRKLREKHQTLKFNYFKQ
ncbi:MAG: ribonuclease HII [Thermoprotei archaeon]|nr:MAG: ribonuclease HII [Thermoprotei archaeon]